MYIYILRIPGNAKVTPGKILEGYSRMLLVDDTNTMHLSAMLTRLSNLDLLHS